jgi:hypothetical protein
VPTEAPAFSDELEAWLRSDREKTIGSLGEVFEARAFAVTILLLMFLPALPIPTGGITHVFELVTLLLAMQMIVGRETIWLPERFRRRPLGAAVTGKAIPFILRRIRWFERHSNGRLARLFEYRWWNRICGFAIIVFTLGAALAPPFSGLDTLPALGVVAICLAIILQDIVVFAIGGVLGVAGIALIITLGAAAARLFEHLF